MQIFRDSFFVYTSTMAKRRKSSKSKRSQSWGFFLVIAIVIIALAVYSSYRTNDKLVELPAGLETPICAAAHHGSDHEIRNFTHYSICYRESYEQAEWSAYCLTEEELVKNTSRSNDFRPDPEISTGSASLADYRKSGYDRGHLSPAADFAFDEKAMSETFFMSNMSPQAGSFNRGIWKDDAPPV